MANSNKYRVVFEASLDTKSFQKQVDKMSGKKINLGAKQAQKEVDGLTGRIGGAIKKTLEWAVATGAVYTSLQQLKQGIQFISDLDESMTNIRIVTGMTREEIDALTKDFNGLAKELNATTLEVSEGALEWFRQGKTIEEANELVTNSIMASKLANMESAEATEYLTSIINGFKLEATEVTGVLDKLVAVDNESATSVAELAEALKRSSSSANQAGVDFDTLTAYIATVSSVTRRSAGSIGESFKTLFARMQNLKLGNLDEMGESVSDVEMVLNKFIGTSLFDAQGNFRDLDNVIDDIAKSWDNLSNVERSAVAKAVAGTRQRENFLVLMQNYNKVLEFQAIQLNSAGLALDRYGIYQESVQAKLDGMKASWEAMWIETLNSEAIGRVYDLAGGLLDVVTNMGGLEPVLQVVVTLLIAFNTNLIISKVSSFSSAIMGLVNAYTLLNAQLSADAVMSGVSKLKALSVAGATAQVSLGAVVIIISELILLYKVLNDISKTAQKDVDDLNQRLTTMYRNVISESGSGIVALNNFENSLNQIKNRYQELAWYQKLFYNEQEITKDALVSFIKELENSNLTYHEYNTAVEKAVELAGYQIDENGRLYRVVSKGNGALGKQYLEVEKLTEGMYLYGSNLQVTSSYINQLVRDNEKLTEKEEELSGETYNLAESFDALHGSLGKAFELIEKQANQELTFDDLIELRNAYENWVDLVEVEGDTIRLNTDALRDFNLERARSEIQIMKNNAQTEKEKEILDAYLRQLELSVPISKDYVQNLQTMLYNVSALAPEYEQISKNIATASEQFRDGQISAQGYFEQLEVLTQDLDLAEMFANNEEAGQIFFAGLAQDATASLSHIASMFDAGEISFSEYTSQLYELSDVFVRIGEMSQGMAEMFGMSGEAGVEWANNIANATQGIIGAQEELGQLQALNMQIEQIFFEQTQNNLQFGTLAFEESMRQVAELAVASGQTVVDAKGNILSDTNEIFNYLVGTEGNFVNFADQVANATGNTMQQLRTNIGYLLVDIGNAISNFEFNISIVPTLQGMQGFIPTVTGFIGSILGDVGSFELPVINLGITGGKEIGGAISSFGQSLISKKGAEKLTSSVYTPSTNQVTGTSGTESDAYKNIGNAIAGANNEAQKLKDTQKEIADLIEEERKKQIEALKEQMEGYDKVIDKRLELLETMKAERAYQDELSEKNKTISDIKAEILDLSMDDTEEAKRKRQELEAELATKQKELETFQFEHAIEMQEQALEQERQRLEDEIDAKIKIVEGIQATSVQDFIKKLKKALGGSLPTDTSTTQQTQALTSNQSFINNANLQSAIGSFGQASMISNPIMPMLGAYGVPDLSSGTGGITIGKLMEINVAGDFDKSVIPNIEAIAEQVVQKINDAMKLRGINRRADIYSI